MVNNNKIKSEKFRSEEQQELFRFIKILLVVVIFIFAVYFVTRIFVKKDLLVNEKETSVTEINYNKMVFGTILNKKHTEYYVLAFSASDNKAYYYSTLAEKYSSSEEALPIYYIDLDDSMNKVFIASDDKTNSKATSVDELQVGRLTLFKIKDGKFEKYIEKLEEIKSELSIN